MSDYEPPEITELGSVAEVTEGNNFSRPDANSGSNRGRGKGKGIGNGKGRGPPW